MIEPNGRGPSARPPGSQASPNLAERITLKAQHSLNVGHMGAATGSSGAKAGVPKQVMTSREP